MIRTLLRALKAAVGSHPVAALVTAAVIGVGAAVGISVGVEDGGSGTAASTEPANGGGPREDLTIRALGDSVTAGFGYYADGSPVPAGEILGGFKDRLFAAPGKFLFGIPSDAGRCLPPKPPDGRCQSPAGVAYPAVFARRLRVPLRSPNFENLAISGSTPREWLGPHLGDELDRIVAADPDLTVLTLGANPLLQTFLAGGAICARTPFVARCVENEIEEHQVEGRLASVLERLLSTDPDGRLGEVAVFTYHEARPIPAFGAKVSVLLDRLVEAVEAAVSGTRARRPQDAARLIVLSPPSFDDHQCFDDEPWLLLTDTCIHPNALGQQMFADALLEEVAGRLPPPPAEGSPPAGAAQPELAIEVTEDGSVVRVGRFRPTQYLGQGGPSSGVEPTLANAIIAFGPPASRRRTETEVQSGCQIAWPALSLTATSDDFGGGPVCSGTAGIVDFSVVGAGASRWRTDRGLRVGDGDDRLLELYPGAYVDPFREHTWILAEEASPIGTTGTIPRLSATVIDTRIAAIAVHLYGAGE